jgi:hypothetical protein
MRLNFSFVNSLLGTNLLERAVCITPFLLLSDPTRRMSNEHVRSERHLHVDLVGVLPARAFLAVLGTLELVQDITIELSRTEFFSGIY